MNLLISDASGMSVLTAWAAGKFSASTIKKFFDEYDIDEQDQVPHPDHPRQGRRDEGRDSGQAARLERGRRPHGGCQLPKFLKDEEYHEPALQEADAAAAAAAPR